jgi:hypothetical protein
MNRLLLSLLFVALFFSCKKEENEKIPDTSNTPTPPISTFKFSCKVNGVNWGTDSTFNQYFFDTGLGIRHMICIGFDSSRSVSVNWASPGLGTMYVSLNNNSVPDSALVLYEGWKNGVYLDEYYPISGHLHFTAYDSIAKTISGTFESILIELNVNDTVILTNGVFSGLSFDVIVL